MQRTYIDVKRGKGNSHLQWLCLAMLNIKQNQDEVILKNSENLVQFEYLAGFICLSGSISFAFALKIQMFICFYSDYVKY